MHNTCQPIVQHRPKGALLQPNEVTDSLTVPRGAATGPCTAFQSATLVPTQYGSTMEEESLRKDPLYAMQELVRFAAHAESQILNLIQAQVKTKTQAFEFQSERSMDNLRYHKDLLDEHIERIADTIQFLSQRGGNNWRSKEVQSEIARESLESRLSDFEYLSKQGLRQLANLCVEGSNTIMQKASLEESRKGLSQAAAIGRLTLLAFIFLPLSAVISLFGTNFKELGKRPLEHLGFRCNPRIPAGLLNLCRTATHHSLV